MRVLLVEDELAPDRTLAITLQDGRLHGQPSGGEKRTLVHVSGATFSAADTPHQQPLLGKHWLNG